MSQTRQHRLIDLDPLDAVRDHGSGLPCQAFVSLGHRTGADVGIFKGEPLDGDPVGRHGCERQIAVEARGAQRVKIDNGRRGSLLAGEGSDLVREDALRFTGNSTDLVAIGDGGIQPVVDIDAVRRRNFRQQGESAGVFGTVNAVPRHIEAQDRLPAERDLALAGLGDQRRRRRQRIAEGIDIGQPLAPVARGVEDAEADEDILRRARAHLGEIHGHVVAVEGAVIQLGEDGVDVVVALPLHDHTGDPYVILRRDHEGLRLADMHRFFGSDGADHRGGIVPLHRHGCRRHARLTGHFLTGDSGDRHHGVVILRTQRGEDIVIRTRSGLGDQVRLADDAVLRRAPVYAVQLAVSNARPADADLADLGRGGDALGSEESQPDLELCDRAAETRTAAVLGIEILCADPAAVGGGDRTVDHGGAVGRELTLCDPVTVVADDPVDVQCHAGLCDGRARGEGEPVAEHDVGIGIRSVDLDAEGVFLDAGVQHFADQEVAAVARHIDSAQGIDKVSAVGDAVLIASRGGISRYGVGIILVGIGGKIIDEILRLIELAEFVASELKGL